MKLPKRFHLETVLILIVLIGAVFILPWIVAYRSDQMTRFQYGKINGKTISCVAVDGTHFDRFACLVYSHENFLSVKYTNGRILLNGNFIEFPRNCNVGWLRADGQIEFESLPQEDFEQSSESTSEVGYVFGRIPKLKKWHFGVPRRELVEKKVEVL